MTVPIQDPIVSYTGNGVATVFTIPFRILIAEDLTVLNNGLLTAAYTLTGLGDDQATLTFALPPNAGAIILAYRQVALDRLTDYQFNGDLRAVSVNADFDRIWMALQDTAGVAGRSLHYPIEEFELNSELPNAATRATKALIFDSSGNAALSSGPYQEGSDIVDQAIAAANEIVAGITTPTFQAFVPTTLLNGSDFIAGTSVSVALPATPNPKVIAGVFFDGTYQSGTQYTLNGAQTLLTFSSAIPMGTNEVNIMYYSPGVLGSFTQVGFGAVPRSYQAKLTDVITLKDFGAKLDGTTDDTQRVINAFHSGEKLITSTAGDCLVDGTINITVDRFKFRAAGRQQTRFIAANANLAVFKVAAGLTAVDLSNFGITRNVPATAGGEGVDWSNIGSQPSIQDVYVEKCWRGLILGPTDYGKAVRIVSQLNYSNGFAVTNGSSGQPCQWSIGDSLAQNNDGCGLIIDGSSNAGGGISLGEIYNFSTFANGSFGILALGTPGNPINGLRILGGFLGGDGNTEIFLDTYGGQHKILGTEFELTGTQPTGHANATPPSNIGNAIAITANNQRVQVSDPNINGTSGSGILMNGTVLSISNPHITNCGIALIAGDRNGIVQSAGRTTVVGGYISDTGQNCQSFGASVGAGAVMHLTGTDLTGNTGAPTTGAGTIVLSNCLP